MLLNSFCLVAIAACATGYQSRGFTGGYTNKKISDSSYFVTFSGNGYATKDRVWDFFIYRCAELTVQNGYALFMIPPAQAAPKAAELGPAVPEVPLARDDAEDAPMQFIRTGGHGGGGTVVIVGGGGAAVTKWSYSGTVLMFKRPLPGEVLVAIDAQVILDTLKPYVQSGDTRRAPRQTELLRAALTGHARIDFGQTEVAPSVDPDAALIATLQAPATPPVAKPLRQPDEIEDSIDMTRIVQLHEAFSQHLARDPRATFGTVTLRFTVAGNGVVTGCTVLDSTFADRAFAATVAAIFREVNFGLLGVAPTTVSLPISFATNQTT
jgi:hypothetical protein